MNEQIQIEKKQREELNRHEAIRMEQERFEGLMEQMKSKTNPNPTHFFSTLVRQITFSQELR